MNKSINNDRPLIPTDGAPVATEAKAYSICTNLPEGLKVKNKAQGQ